MSDNIYIVDPKTGEPTPVKPVSFSDIGIKERDDLEKWVVNHPAVLGESLLVITSEFDRFDKSNRRLDVIALDKNCNLVIIELKLDAGRSLADLQAIRYAAFCSTMTTEDMISTFATFNRCSEEDAAEKICTFIGEEEIPELNDRPRIIVAAGSIDDQELTSSVLWLRSFGVEISCVELTPYVMPSNSEIVLVPKTIIPIPEAKDYIVSVEKKQAAKARQEKNTSQFSSLWRAVADEFNNLDTGFRVTGNAKQRYMQIAVGYSGIHYEWQVQQRQRVLEVALHFELKDGPTSNGWLDLIKPHLATINDGLDYVVDGVPFGKRWTAVRMQIPYEGALPDTSIALLAAQQMKIFIERTWPYIELRIRRNDSR